MPIRVITWNLFHGRADPARDANLLGEFARLLAGWEWDVALLQEVPPWWPEQLARAAGAQERHALTSRNALLPLRRAIAQRWPELLKANGGGCNAILVRGATGLSAPPPLRLRTWPERRVVHAVRDGEGRWFANLHASTGRGRRTQEDVERARAEALRWAGDAPLVFGGDFNMAAPALRDLVLAGGDRIDHVYARGWRPAGGAELLDRGTLSDHAPVRVGLTR